MLSFCFFVTLLYFLAGQTSSGKHYLCSLFCRGSRAVRKLGGFLITHFRHFQRQYQQILLKTLTYLLFTPKV